MRKKATPGVTLAVMKYATKYGKDGYSEERN